MSSLPVRELMPPLITFIPILIFTAIAAVHSYFVNPDDMPGVCMEAALEASQLGDAVAGGKTPTVELIEGVRGDSRACMCAILDSGYKPVNAGEACAIATALGLPCGDPNPSCTEVIEE